MEKSKQLKPYLVYRNKTNDVWVSDAYAWMELHSFKEEDFECIISEVAYNWDIHDGTANGRPVYWVTEILTKH